VAADMADVVADDSVAQAEGDIDAVAVVVADVADDVAYEEAVLALAEIDGGAFGALEGEAPDVMLFAAKTSMIVRIFGA
jgi:hypothetical protein